MGRHQKKSELFRRLSPMGDLLLSWNNITTVLLALNLVLNGAHGLADPPPAPIFAYGDGTPFPDALKCYTCEEKTNNHECNRKAYDAFCPEGTKYCYTRHHLNQRLGESILVTKKCAINDVCAPHVVGCQETGIVDQRICISCCEGSLCNIDVPTNDSTAVFTTITPYNEGPPSRTASRHLVLTLSLLTVAYVFRIAAT